MNPCGCGNQGCLEAMASGTGIAKRYHKDTGIMLDAQSIAALARTSDASALMNYRQTGCYLGRAISHAVNLLNLPKVVLGGGVLKSFDLFCDSLHSTFDRHVFGAANRNCVIEKTALGVDAALIGCAALFLHSAAGS